MRYGYVRVSTPKQSLERQVRNIKSAYPDAVIIRETYTGTTVHRPGFEKLLKMVRPGDEIIFDSVSRMSRSADEGAELYQQLFEQGIDLVFLKEPHINTQTYRKALENQIAMTGESVDYILDGINRFLLALAREQIRLAFQQAEKEVMDLRQRTREGIYTARLNGKQIGQPKGSTFETKKAKQAKALILKYSKDFNGTLPDTAVMRLVGVSRNSYYRYKKILKQQ